MSSGRTGTRVANGEPVTEISGRLRAARERAGLTVEAISARTKIAVPLVRAIESGEFERLPGEFYIRAFLKAYAREVGIPPDEAAAAYTAEHHGDGEMASGDLPVEPPPPRVARIPAGSPLRLVHGARTEAMAIVGVALLLLALVTANRTPPRHENPRASGAVGTSGATQAAPSPTDRAPQAETPPDKLVIEIVPSAPIWVTSATDGIRRFSRLLAPGERVTLEARSALSFRIGNAVAFNYKINGVPGKSLGGPDEVREFQITPDNYRTFRR